MDQTLRTGIAISALAFSSFVLAAPGDPPPAGGIDLGAMKLKKAVAPGQAAPAAATTAPAAPAATTALPAVQRKQVNTAVLQNQQNQQNQAAPQQVSNTPPPTNATNQTGVGTVVGAAPIGRKTAAEILGQSSNQTQQQSSGDVQVKMPSMFKKVNPN
jgi:hypothetical protein